MSTVLAKKPNIPYISTPLNLQCGQIIRIVGKIKPNGKRIAVDLQHGNQFTITDDVPLHIDFRPVEQNCIVRNSLEYNSWMTEETNGGCPIKVGHFFELIIQMGQDKFQIAINGTHFCEFKYRLPLHMARFLHIYRAADISTVSLENVGGAGVSNVTYPLVETIYNTYPLIMPISNNGLFVGKRIYIHGKTAVSAERIRINFQNTPSVNPEEDGYTLIAFHMSIWFSQKVIVLNTLQRGWGNEEHHRDFPFDRNQNYIICILVRNDYFTFEINGKPTFIYMHRLSLDECKYFYLIGDTSARVVL